MEGYTTMRETISLWEETLNIITTSGKTINTVTFVCCNNSIATISEFEQISKDIYYDAGYGSTEINMNLYIVGIDWWLERYQYEGCECWKFKHMPARPYPSVPLTRLHILQE